MEQKLIRTKGSNKGITLVALVVTIIVLMILASISIGAVFSEKGIIQQSKETKEKSEKELETKKKNLNDILMEYNNEMKSSRFPNDTGENSNNEDAIQPMPTLEPTATPEIPDENKVITSIKDTNHDTIEGEDNKGNKVVIPGDFKISEDSGETVEDGIIIEDDIGNQFVWIPVSNINHDGSNKIKKNDGTEVEITLGRYKSSSASSTPEQLGVNYRSSVTINNLYTESSSTALGEFIDSVDKNKGFYIARFEASYASGTTFGVGENEEYYRPASKVSKIAPISNGTLTEGRLWNFITRTQAAQASGQMYYGSSYIKSGLVNSYMWDTTLVYIEAMGYAGYTSKLSSSVRSPLNTGKTSDEVCHIFDMWKNLEEWTTEVSSSSYVQTKYPCVGRGGSYIATRSAIGRYGKDVYSTSYSGASTGFRVGLYLK